MPHPPSRRAVVPGDPDRIARMTVLVWAPPGGPAQNLFTLVRTHHRDAAGPWTRTDDHVWVRQDLGNELRLLRLDTTDEEARKTVQRVVESGSLLADGSPIRYTLNLGPYHHRAYRDNTGNTETAIVSPFQNHSAAITEYWGISQELLQRWFDLSDAPESAARPPLCHLGVSLETLPDRVGNLVLADAEDAFVAYASFDRFRSVVRFRTTLPEPVAKKHIATIWGYFSGNCIAHRKFLIPSGTTSVKMPANIDRLGFSIHDMSTGDCIDLMDSFLVMEAHFDIDMLGRKTEFKDPTTGSTIYVHQSSNLSRVSVSSDQGMAGLDGQIRQRWLRRVHLNRERKARRDRVLARFDPNDIEAAAKYFLDLLRRDRRGKEPIYIGDPYFLWTREDAFLRMFYLRILGETSGQVVRILCGTLDRDNLRAWLLKLPQHIRRHVSIRSFRRRGSRKPLFHDRYIVTRERETAVTNSINGWKRHGVTFAGLSSDVYRTNAEELWSLSDGPSDTETLVRTILERGEC